MIIDYDHNPHASFDQKLLSLKESVQRALDEKSGSVTIIQHSGSGGGGGSGGTTDYEALSNKPSINSVMLIGNKTSEDLGIDDMENITNSELEAALTL